MPPVITNVNVCPVQLLTPVRDTEVGVTTSVDGVGTGVPGGAWVPGMLRSCAVVVLPAESWIVNVSGLTQVPLVVARKKLPLDPTTEGETTTPVGKVEATVYGGVPP